MQIKDQLLNQSHAIRTFPIDKIKKLCNSFSLVKHDEIKRFDSKIKNWLDPVVNLTNFGYLYPVNGITEGLNYWMMQEKRRIKTVVDDYAWVPQSSEGEVMYLSCPSSIDGNFCVIPKDIPIVLDLAYVGATAVQRIEIGDNVEKIFFSMSKCFGLRNYRIGYYFSKTPDVYLEKLVGSGKYYNYYSMQLGELLIDAIGIDDVYKELSCHQKTICDALNFTPSDTVWLATTADHDYDKFKKGSSNRINISELIKHEYCSSIL